MLETNKESTHTTEETQRPPFDIKKAIAITLTSLFIIVCLVALVFVTKNDKQVAFDTAVKKKQEAKIDEVQKIQNQLAELAQFSSTTVDKKILKQQVSALGSSKKGGMSSSTQEAVLGQLKSLNH